MAVDKPIIGSTGWGTVLNAALDYLDVTDQVIGYEDHGTISGSQTFSGPSGSHWFNASAATTITLSGYDEGEVVTLICFSGAEDVSVLNAGGPTLVDGSAWTAQLARGTWVSGSGGVADSTPPSAVTDLNAIGGEGTITLNWSDQTDAESTVVYRYRAWLTSGGAQGTWSSTSVSNATITGLSSGDYTAEVYAYSAGGASATDTATATVTGALVMFFTDTFTAADDTILTSRTADTGETWAGNASIRIFDNAMRYATDKVYAVKATVPREITFDVKFDDGSGIIVWAWSTDGVGTGPRMVVSQNGQIQLDGSAHTITYNASGGTNPYTPTGYVTITAGVSYAAKLTYDGTNVALYWGGTKILEGTVTSPPLTGLNTVIAGTTGFDAQRLDNLVMKA